MSEQTKYTPKDSGFGLPWKLEVLGDQLRITKSDFETDNDDIAGIGDCRKEANKAQGDFIVRACNAHDALMALAERISHLNPDAGEIGDGTLHMIVEMADYAIAKAGAA